MRIEFLKVQLYKVMKLPWYMKQKNMTTIQISKWYVIWIKVKYYISVKLFWLSIRKKENCLFSRRNGYRGKIIKGYSIRLTIMGFDII